MKPINFLESTGVLGPPKGHEKSVLPLPVFRDGVQCISCWELTDEEMETIKRTRRVYVGIISGQTQPPIRVQVIKPFQKEFSLYMSMKKEMEEKKGAVIWTPTQFETFTKLQAKYEAFS
ncbi:MAG TPA: hypothetical protein VMW32_05780 [Bacteroidales bacterium]|nr:hypothetical protein [Bacteroidales bacterium]